MTMNAYAVYDVDTGEVVHLHVEPAGLDSSPEEIVQLAGPRGAQRLEVVQVSATDAAAQGHRVVDGRLVPAGGEAGTGGAGGGDGQAEPDVPRHYERRTGG